MGAKREAKENINHIALPETQGSARMGRAQLFISGGMPSSPPSSRATQILNLILQ
jgi:hypothetical protein